MNVEPVLLALQAAFLILLYVFIWRVVRSAGRDMQVAPQESFILAPSQLAAEHQVSDPGRLVVERSKAIPVGKSSMPGPCPSRSAVQRRKHDLPRRRRVRLRAACADRIPARRGMGP